MMAAKQMRMNMDYAAMMPPKTSSPWKLVFDRLFPPSVRCLDLHSCVSRNDLCVSPFL